MFTILNLVDLQKIVQRRQKRDARYDLSQLENSQKFKIKENFTNIYLKHVNGIERLHNTLNI